MKTDFLIIIVIVIILIFIFCKSESRNIEKFTTISPANINYINDFNGTIINPSLDIIGNLEVNGSCDLIPSGIIVPYNGNTAPNAWAICDGTNNTPDLRNRMIVGSGSSYVLNTNGGNIDRDGKLLTKITLQPKNLPPHTHTYGIPTSRMGAPQYLNGSGDGNYSLKNTSNTGDGKNSTQYPNQSLNTGTPLSVGNGSGGVDPIETLPPCYALNYIMKL